jgi:hypothetical protein
MSNFITKQARILIVSVCSLFIVVLLSACQGVVTSNGSGYSSNGATTTGSNYITGQIQSVNLQAHSVTLLVNGQQFTVSGLSDQQTAALQSQVNQTYTFQVTQSGTNAYTINQNTQPQEANSNNNSNNTSTSSSTSNQSGTPVQGNIQFAGKVQSINGSNVVVSTPDGQSLTVTVITNQANSTDLSDMKGMQLSSGQVVKVKAITDQNGNFVATKVGIDKLDDQQKDLMTVQYQGVTTSAVGADRRISFKVGNKSYSFPISTIADLKDFGNNAQSIGNNVVVKVKVTFNGTNGTATDISNPNN